MKERQVELIQPVVLFCGVRLYKKDKSID